MATRTIERNTFKGDTPNTLFADVDVQMHLQTKGNCEDGSNINVVEVGKTSKGYTSNTSTKNHPKFGPRGFLWYISWFILALITITGQIIFTELVISDLIYIFENINSWPIYSLGEMFEPARGIISIGQRAHGIIAIGQFAHGIVAVGQVSFGIISIGQVSIGLVFAFGQVGGGLGVALGQAMIATRIIYAQIGLAAWKITRGAQFGFNIGASIMKRSKLLTSCHIED